MHTTEVILQASGRLRIIDLQNDRFYIFEGDKK